MQYFSVGLIPEHPKNVEYQLLPATVDIDTESAKPTTSNTVAIRVDKPQDYKEKIENLLSKNDNLGVKLLPVKSNKRFLIELIHIGSGLRNVHATI